MRATLSPPAPKCNTYCGRWRRSAVTDSTVCLYGESGTGKELIGKSVHAMSRRARGPFVAIELRLPGPEGLLENELFGHVKEPIRELISCTAASYDRLMVGRYFWMKSATFPTRVTSQVPAGSSGTGILSPGCRAANESEFSPHRRDQPGFVGSGVQREISRGSLLPDSCHPGCPSPLRAPECPLLAPLLTAFRTPSTKELEGFPPRPCSY